MKVKTSYELMCKVPTFKWRIFDTYKEKSDPELRKYFNLLNSQKLNGGVKIIKVETTRSEVFI